MQMSRILKTISYSATLFLAVTTGLLYFLGYVYLHSYMKFWGIDQFIKEEFRNILLGGLMVVVMAIVEYIKLFSYLFLFLFVFTLVIIKIRRSGLIKKVYLKLLRLLVRQKKEIKEIIPVVEKSFTIIQWILIPCAIFLILVVIIIIGRDFAFNKGRLVAELEYKRIGENKYDNSQFNNLSNVLLKEPGLTYKNAFLIHCAGSFCAFYVRSLDSDSENRRGKTVLIPVSEIKRIEKQEREETTINSYQ